MTGTGSNYGAPLGSFTVTVVPFQTLFLMSSLPSCKSTSDLVIDNPGPIPSPLHRHHFRPGQTYWSVLGVANLAPKERVQPVEKLELGTEGHFRNAHERHVQLDKLF